MFCFFQHRAIKISEIRNIRCTQCIAGCFGTVNGSTDIICFSVIQIDSDPDRGKIRFFTIVPYLKDIFYSIFQTIGFTECG